MSRPRCAFVLEQSLGHVAHGQNLEAALAGRPDLEATVIRVDFESGSRLQPWPGLHSWSVRASWTARSALRRRLADGPLDAVLIHTQVAALLAAGLMRRVPTVVSLDATPLNFDSQGEAYGHRRQVELVERLKRAVNRRALLGAQALVTWCEWARDSLVGDYGIPDGRVHVVHPGVDQALFRPAERRRSGPPRLLFVGGDFERKGGGDLLEAVAGLDEPFELHLVTGAPPWDESGGELERPGVHVHTSLRPRSAELVELYRQADVFVLPSRGDCFPQVVAEAMACGLPVVASDVGAVSEMVRDGFNGCLVPPRSPRSLRAVLRRLLREPHLRHALGARSLELARSRHDARRNCNALFDLMLDAAGTRRRSG